MTCWEGDRICELPVSGVCESVKLRAIAKAGAQFEKWAFGCCGSLIAPHRPRGYGTTCWSRCGLAGRSAVTVEVGLRGLIYAQAMHSGAVSCCLQDQDQDVDLLASPAACLHACCHEDNGLNL